MARLLALDTSTEACSVALLDGDRVDERFIEAPREHMLRLLPMVDELLAAHGFGLKDLDAIAFGRGPGSFTGLRICLGVAQGLAFGADRPVIPISTLAALAQDAASNAEEGALVLAAIDARMDEVYWGWFRRTATGLVEPLGPETVSRPEAVEPPSAVLSAQQVTPALAAHRRLGVGSGFNYGERMPVAGLDAIDASALPHAAAVARLALPRWLAGDTVAAEAAAPVYLRDEVAWKKA